MAADEVAIAYKNQWRVERTFQKKKSVLEVRPLYHQSDKGRIGHIVSSFLALRLEVDMQRRLEERGSKVPWVELMRELKRAQVGEIEVEGQRYEHISKPQGAALEAFKAAGVRVQEQIRLL